MDLAQHRTTPMQTQDTDRILGRVKAAPHTPPSADEFARADEHLPAGTKAAGYVRLACGGLLPVRREVSDDGSDRLDLFVPYAFGRDAMIGWSRRAFARKMLAGQAWHASAADVARSLDPAGFDFMALPRAYSGDLTSTAGEGRR